MTCGNWASSESQHPPRTAGADPHGLDDPQVEGQVDLPGRVASHDPRGENIALPPAAASDIHDLLRCLLDEPPIRDCVEVDDPALPDMRHDRGQELQRALGEVHDD